MRELDDYWDQLTNQGFATDEELQLVVTGWGYTKETLETVLYVRTGYNSFEQLPPDCGDPGPDCVEHNGECD